MQISPVTQNNNATSFSAAQKLRYDTNGRPYFNTTKFFRDDLNWEALVQYIHDFYKDTPQVNIITHGCSDGEETYSFLFKLRSMFKEKADKFIIQGRDFDGLNIVDAKKGIYEISAAELSRMQQECDLDLFKYIDIVTEYNNKIVIRVKKHMQELLNFKKSDITKDLATIPQENTVLSARNMWPYLMPHDQIELIKKLSEHLKPNSFILLGSFDTINHIDKLFERAGFIHTGIKGLMKKAEPVSKTQDTCDARIILSKLKMTSKSILKRFCSKPAV